MLYHSTHGGIHGKSFEEVLFSGWAPDGGLYLPEVIPSVHPLMLSKWSKLNFAELTKQIMGLFIGLNEIPTDKISEIVDKAFKSFDDPLEVVKSVELKGGLTVLELFHGPTLAFKDIALSVVGQLLQYFLQKKKKRTVILVGTSGDTGSAAISSVHGLENIDIIVLYPKGRCSEIQQLQMVTNLAKNVHVYEVEGTSDELDVPIKACFMNSELVEHNNICSINSINWARIMLQIVVYFYLHLKWQSKLSASSDRSAKLEVLVPTGACGNLTAGFVAEMMGASSLAFRAATNANDVVHRVLAHGDYSINSECAQTLATAMDIQEPYNLSRLLFLISGGNAGEVRRMSEELSASGRTKISPQVLAWLKDAGRTPVESMAADDAAIRESMLRCWREDGYRLCPHTAAAATWHYRHLDTLNSTRGRVVLATASAAKFPEALAAAGVEPASCNLAQELRGRATRFEPMKRDENWQEILRLKIQKLSP